MPAITKINASMAKQKAAQSATYKPLAGLGAGVGIIVRVEVGGIGMVGELEGVGVSVIITMLGKGVGLISLVGG
jgi:hypothetical protein